MSETPLRLLVHDLVEDVLGHIPGPTNELRLSDSERLVWEHKWESKFLEVMKEYALDQSLGEYRGATL